MSSRTPVRLDDDPLAQRLASLEIPTPEFHAEARTAGTPVVFVAAARHRRRVAGGALLAAALLVLVVAATYPTIGQDALRWAGLLPTQIEPMQGTASFGSATMTVSGGYADPIGTVLFASFDHAYCAEGPILTDQFGERYLPTGGWGVDAGIYPVVFEPLRGAAATAGARLTLHCVLGAGGHDLAAKLSGTLTVGTVTTIPTPAAIVEGGTTYEIVSLRWSGTYLEVHSKISGRLIEDLVARSDALRSSPPPGGGGVTFPGVFVVDGSGQSLIPIAVSDERDFGTELEVNHMLDETRVFTVRSAGSYRIIVSTAPDSATLAAWSIRAS